MGPAAPGGFQVLANRQTGPEQVLQMAADRPDTPLAELDAVLAGYRKLAGFDAEQVNARYEQWQRELLQPEAAAAGGAAAAARPGGGGGSKL